MNAKTLRGLAILAAVVFSGIVPPRFICVVFGDERVAAHIDSPLNQENLEKILDNRCTITEAEIVQMLGPPMSIEVSAVKDTAPYLRMAWEDVSRIEMTCREERVVALRGRFSPRLVSQSINYPTFKRIALGSSVNRVCREFFLGHNDRIVKSSDGETTTRIFETYVQLYVYFSDGKVTSATRLECLNR